MEKCVSIMGNKKTNRRMVSLFNIRMRICLDAYWTRVVAHRLGAVMAITTLLNGMAAMQDFAGAAGFQ